MNPTDILALPIVQCGFAGLCFVLLVVVVWLTRQLIRLMEKNGEVMSQVGKIIEANTKAVSEVGALSGQTLSLLREVNNKFLARPCIARHEDGGGAK